MDGLPEYMPTGRGSTISLNSLPTDILILIAEYLPLQHAKSLALVNRALLVPAQYRILRCITINARVADFEPSRTGLQTLEHDDWLPAVRAVTVLDHVYDYSRLRYRGNRDNHPDAAVQSRRHGDICIALRAMSGLQVLDWQGNHIPDTVLECLSSLPRVRLSAHVHELRQRQVRALMGSEHGLLHCLQRCATLYALDVETRYSRVDECIAFNKALKGVLLSCSRLRKLRLDIAMPSGGCVIYTTPSEYHGLGFTDEEKMPPLEELHLVAYPFGRPPQDSRTENSIGYRLAIDEEAFWARHFDWSRLRCLSVDGQHFADAHMPALRELVIHESGNGHKFLYRLTPSKLHSLSFRLNRRLGLHCLLPHAANLTRLVLHGSEGHMVDDRVQEWADQCPAAFQLRQLRDACRVLEELEVDMVRGDHSWPLESLETLSSFAGLKKLTLWFELPITAVAAGSYGPAKPYMTFQQATMLFKHLRQRGSGITEMVLHSGAQSPMRPGRLVEEGPNYGEENSTTFRCTLSERDCDVGQERSVTTCLDACERANEWMRANLGLPSSVTYVEGMTFEDFYEREVAALGKAAQRSFRVACHGPVPLEEWEEEADSLLF